MAGPRFSELYRALEETRYANGHAPRSTRDAAAALSAGDVAASLAAALWLPEATLAALPEAERLAARELRSSPHYTVIREEVEESLGLGGPPPVPPPATPSVERIVYDSRTNRVLRRKGSRHRDPVWEDADADMTKPLAAPLEEKLQAVAAEAGLDLQVVAMCQQALAMTVEELSALPEDARAKVLEVRESPMFAPLRHAARRIAEAEAAAEQRLLQRAQAARLDPRLIRSVASALRMTDWQLAAVGTDHERDVLREIRTSDAFAPVRQICYELELARPLPTPDAATRSQQAAVLPSEAVVPSPACPDLGSQVAAVDPTANRENSRSPPPEKLPAQPVWRMEVARGEDGESVVQVKVTVELPELESIDGL
eukprot:EG_transcript_12433